MANEISRLLFKLKDAIRDKASALTGANSAAGDKFLVLDVSTEELLAMTRAELIVAMNGGTAGGTVVASSAVVVDANKDISAFRNVTATNYDAGVSGTAGTFDVFPTTAAKGKLALTASDSAGDTTTTITNASQAAARTYTVPDAGAAGWFMLGGAGVVTLATNAGTLSQLAGRITTEALTTAGGASQALTITDTLCAATSLIFVQWSGGSSTTGTPIIKAVPGAGSFVVTLYNQHASAAFNGTFILDFVIAKAA